MQPIKYTTAPVIVIESEQSLTHILDLTIRNDYPIEYRKFENPSDVSGYSITKTHLYNGDKVYVFNITTLELAFIKGINANDMSIALIVATIFNPDLNITTLEFLKPDPSI
jgi:hypothetical protein